MVEKEYVTIRRQWNDYNIATVKLDKIEGLHWDSVSGGIHANSPQPFVHGYVWCTDVQGEIAHSHIHGEGPHRIKVCVVKKDNDKQIWRKIVSIIGPKPKR